MSLFLPGKNANKSSFHPETSLPGRHSESSQQETGNSEPSTKSNEISSNPLPSICSLVSNIDVPPTANCGPIQDSIADSPRQPGKSEPSKPKIWSLADTATSNKDNDRYRNFRLNNSSSAVSTAGSYYSVIPPTFCGQFARTMPFMANDTPPQTPPGGYSTCHPVNMSNFIMRKVVDDNSLEMRNSNDMILQRK